MCHATSKTDGFEDAFSARRGCWNIKRLAAHIVAAFLRTGPVRAPERGGAIRAGPWFVGRLAGRGGGTVGCWRAAWPYRCKGCLVPVGAVGAKAPTHMKEIALSGGFRVFQPYFFGECTNCTKHQPPFPTCATSVKITLTTFGRAFFPPIGYTYRNRWCRLV